MGRPNVASDKRLAQLIAAADIPARTSQVAANEMGTIHPYAVAPTPGLQLFGLDTGGDSGQR